VADSRSESIFRELPRIAGDGTALDRTRPIQLFGALAAPRFLTVGRRAFLLRALDAAGAALAAAEAEDAVPLWRSDVPRFAGIRGSPWDCGLATPGGWDCVD
jgi:hypothetical protein